MLQRHNNYPFVSSLPANASRFCGADGEWAVKSNYSECKPVSHESILFADNESGLPEDYSFLIYLVGYSLSLITLCVASSIFCYFK